MSIKSTTSVSCPACNKKIHTIPSQTRRFCSQECRKKFTVMNLESSFWERVTKGKTNDDCWFWSGSKDIEGYGRLSLQGQLIKAHRYSYELNKGSIPDAMCVCHSCDNPSCVNPDHLWLGSNADNMKDKARKGRGNQPKGEESGGAKLKSEDVIKIRELLSMGVMQKEIAPLFNITPANVSYISLNKTWTI